VFGHLRRLPIAFFDRQPAGELMSRLTNDSDAINQAVTQNITALLASVLSMLGILIAMFVLDGWLALASLLVASAVGVVGMRRLIQHPCLSPDRLSSRERVRSARSSPRTFRPRPCPTQGC
jgi:ABC-type multidrug transport system fused ATPase/permease subunit